jgi:hypothetical protein
MNEHSQVLLLNDSDEDGSHFGCMCVMRTIRVELEKRGFADFQSIKAGVDWRRDVALSSMIDSARLVVINGEGTLHHGKRRGRWLLEAGARVKAQGGQVALINALWQDNPDDWAYLARDFDILACRDGRSAFELANATGREVTCLGDLSMQHPWTSSGGTRAGVMVGCSVHWHVTEALARFARSGGHDFVPVTTAIKTMPSRLRGLQRWLRKQRHVWQNHLFMTRFPEAHFVRDDSAFLTELTKHDQIITGRFHAVCLAVLSGTPFIAVSSNSWKIEALIRDIGLDPARLYSLRELTQATISERDWAYSEVESAAIAETLARWRKTGSMLFDEIAALRTGRSI